jgi:2-polyprenyl-3-methyl-5-hydroxy-6-metoxy-1,4-benzoquinol methylase
MSVNSETVACDFCASDNYNFYDESQGWKIVKCSSCGFCYTNPRPTEESLPQFYEQNYYLNNELFGESYSEDGKAEAGFTYPKRITEVENWFNERGSILEIGAARGGYVNALAKRGWTSKGIDISKYAVEFGKQLYKVDLISGTLDTVKFNEKFDAIVMYQVLEHVPSPKFVLERSYELLKDDGVIVIEVPNLESFDMKISKDRKRLSYDLPRHLSHFTPSFLKSELVKLGFKILDIDLYHPEFILNFAEFIESRKKGVSEKAEVNHSEQSTNGKIQYNLPMQKKSESWKVKLLNSVSFLLPGWRFTIVARK